MARYPRTFASLRGEAADPREESNLEPIADVIRRIYRTPDGRRLFDHMMVTSHGPSPEGAEERALREQEGARKFVAKLAREATSDDTRRRSPGDASSSG